MGCCFKNRDLPSRNALCPDSLRILKADQAAKAEETRDPGKDRCFATKAHRAHIQPCDTQQFM